MATRLIGSIPKPPATEAEIKVTILCPQCAGGGCVCCQGDAIKDIPHIAGTVYSTRRFGAAQYLTCADPECGAKYGTAYFTQDVGATGTITFTGVPADGGTITISDGVDSVVFEITDGVGSGGTTLVDREISAAAQATDMITAINASLLTITASSGGSGVVSLTHDTIGPVGNVAITRTATNTTVTGMANGSYSETPPPFQHCRYCGTTATWTTFTPTEYTGESPAP